MTCADLGGQGVPWSVAATAAGGGYLPCPDPTTEANCGASMEISSQLLVAGAFPSSQIFLLEKNPLTQQWQPAQIGDLATPIPGQMVGENWFGYGLSADGSRLAVSAPLHGSPGNAVGIVFVFGKDAQTDCWQQQAVIENPIPEPFDWFGMSVSLQGHLLVVGAPGDRNAQGVDSGAVFIFERDATTDLWTLEQVIWNPAADPGGDAFGEMVDLVGDRLLVGAPGTRGPGGEEASGCGYIYQRSSTSFDLQQVIPNPDAAAGEAMGRSLALTDHHLAFGIPDDLPAGVSNGGSVYLYRHEPISGQWVPADTGIAGATVPGQIPCPDPLDLDNFGIDVGLSGDVLVVGASRDEVNGFSSAGSCSIYERSETTGQWPLRQKIDNPEPDEGDQFGFALALDQNQLAVGVKLEQVNGIIGAGAAFVFQRSGSFIRPDCNADGAFNLADAITVLSVLFSSGLTPDCRDACDANDDGSLNLSDAVMMLNDLYVPGAAPIPSPIHGCGIDPTDDSLDCIEYTCP
ncbi:MAG: hypothetical protein OSB09_10325 [Planctomycetota bacterium]|nr:hypothetical protein [Planctomycetota bacterium]